MMQTLKKLKILGIDPGTNLMGWGLVEKDGAAVRPLGYGCVVTTKDLHFSDRLVLLFKGITELIEKHAPDEIAIEQLFLFKNQKTVMSVAEARGVAVLAARLQEKPVYEYTPLQVKQALTGYGRADKKQMQEMVRITCKLKECPKPDDAADALAIAICHAQTCRHIAGK